jgi:hypothetical protein
LLDFGTTDPELVITSAGTWLIHYYCRVDYTGTTYVGNETVTIKLRRTNNTAADLTNSTREALLQIVTTLDGTATVLSGTIPYVTTNADDNIQMWGSVTALPAAGSVDAVEAAIVAERIHQ